VLRRIGIVVAATLIVLAIVLVIENVGGHSPANTYLQQAPALQHEANENARQAVEAEKEAIEVEREATRKIP